MTPQDKAQMLSELNRLTALVSNDVAACFAIVVIHPNESSTDIADLALPQATRYADKLIQQMDRLLFKLKAGLYLATPQRSGPGPLAPERPGGNGQ